MSEQTVLSTNEMVLYIPLLNEGTNVLRAAKGLAIGQDTARVLATADYNPELEDWQFPPGSTVRFTKENHSGREILVARQGVT
jgi:hypothetical protein